MLKLYILGVITRGQYDTLRSECVTQSNAVYMMIYSCLLAPDNSTARCTNN